MSVRVWLSTFAVAAVAACSSAPQPASAPAAVTPRADSLVVDLPGLPESSFLTKKHEANTGTCNSGGNVSPAIQWSRWPAETKSFAIVMSDPDGGRGRG